MVNVLYPFHLIYVREGEKSADVVVADNALLNAKRQKKRAEISAKQKELGDLNKPKLGL